MKIFDQTKEIDDEYYKFYGHSRCVGISTSKWLTGYPNCFEAARPACAFTRVYAESRDDDIYEVLKCPTWKYRVKVMMNIINGKKISKKELLLTLGEVVSFDNIKVALKSISAPDIPALADSYLYSKSRGYAIITPAAKGIVSGYGVGAMQCADKTQAGTIKFCEFSEESYNVEVSGTTVAIHTKAVDLAKIYRPDNTLPLDFGGVVIDGNGTELVAAIRDIAVLELHTEMIGRRFAAVHDKNKCQVESPILKGCYLCNQGATLNIKCKTNFGDAMAMVVCENNMRFSLVCSENSVDQDIILRFGTQLVDTNCVATCPANSDEFNLSGELVFIKNEIINERNLTGIIIPKDGSHDDGGFLLGLDFGAAFKFLGDIFGNVWRYLWWVLLAIVIIFFIFIVIYVYVMFINQPLLTKVLSIIYGGKNKQESFRMRRTRLAAASRSEKEKLIA
jgi:hypothetical protein